MRPRTFKSKIRAAQKLIKEAIAKYPRIAVGCSFGKDSMVLLHLCRKIKKDIPVFSVLANTEFPETFKFKDKVVKNWKLNYTEYVFEQPEGVGENCCATPKVDKTKEAVANLDAWIAGIRRTEGITRANFQPIEEANGLTKINPLLDWTELDIWRYTAYKRIPVNPMYKKGFRSLGCKFCSSRERSENEVERAGRWRGLNKQECGIHTQALK